MDTPPIRQTPESVRKALRAVKDPELNLNIIDIGLVYEIDVTEGRRPPGWQEPGGKPKP